MIVSTSGDLTYCEVEDDASAEDVLAEIGGRGFASHCDVLEQKDAQHWVIGYLCADEDCDNPLEDCDGMGHIYNARDHRDKFLEARGKPFTFALDVYSHGGEHWSLAGENPMRHDRWDLAHSAGIWIPDECALDEINIRESDVDRLMRARELAIEAIDQFNSWLSGDCYGVKILTLKATDDGWEEADEDACWGYVGKEWAEQSLKDEFSFHVARLFPALTVA